MNFNIVAIVFLINLLQFCVAQIVYVGEQEGRDGEVGENRTVDPSCYCGVKPAERIVGGQVALLNEYPWMAALCFNFGLGCEEFFYCAATLINDMYVMTAAHCVDFLDDPSQILVSLNNPYLDVDDEADDVTVVPSTIKIHFAWDPTVFKNDIALIKLSAPVQFRDTLLPICLPPNGIPPYPRRTVFAAGWGRIFTDGPISPQLREVKLLSLSNFRCKRMGYPFTLITKRMICADRPRKSVCNGDSGGPLMYVRRGRNEQIGITSFGVPCAIENFPAVYTRVNKYLGWIYRNAKSGTYCRNQFAPFN